MPGRTGEDYFRHPHFRKQEYYFFLALHFFYKQQGSGFSIQSFLYFQDFRAQRCLMVAL